MFNRLKDVIEKYSFGVCSYLGEKMGISSSVIRKYFIYTSFVAFGSPVILYLVIGFWLNLKKYLKKGKNLILE